jgi:hypothetical protein
VITVGTAPGPAASPPGPARPATERLTAIEELDYLLDRPAEPNLVLLETHTRGHLDRDVLAEAVTAAFGGDPGARRRLAASPRWSRHLYWRPATPASDGAPLTVVSWRTPAELAALRQRLFAWPVRPSEAAVRAVLAVGPDHDAVILQVHHTSGDGVSSVRLFSAVGHAYRARARGSRLRSVPDPSPPPAVVSLPEPIRPAATASARRRPPGWGKAWPGPVTRIAPQGGQPGRPGYGFTLISVPVPRPAARGTGPGPTVNDLLVAALSLAIERWNAAQGRPSGQISVTVPVNGRPAGQRWDGDGNLSWLMRVVTSPAHRADPDLLLRQVAAQTRAAKERGRSDVDALSRLLAAGWAPIGVKRRTARLVRGLTAPVFTDTTLVSNLGLLPDPPSFDGSGTEPMWLAPPCPMPRGLSVGAATVAGQLNLTIRYRLALLDQTAAAGFTAGFRACLSELARPGPEGGARS